MDVAVQSEQMQLQYQHSLYDVDTDLSIFYQPEQCEEGIAATIGPAYCITRVMYADSAVCAYTRFLFKRSDQNL